jgi:hypothetical protein
MTEDELLSQFSSEESQALGYFSGDLSSERERALEYYHGNLESKYAAPEGRSDIVSTDVKDGVDGMLPDLLDIFLSSDDVVRFDPHGPEDEKATKQATDACNYVFYKQNPGALILYEWFKSALMEKNGVVKFYHSKYATPKVETYEALTEPQFQSLLQTPGVEVLAHSAAPDPSMPGMSVHDVRVRVIDQHGKFCIEGMPSEEFLICPDHSSLSMRDVRFAAHRKKLTVSKIREMGIDVDPDEGGTDSTKEFSPEWSSRRRYYEERDYGEKNPTDESLKELVVTEASMLADYDGDGYAERRKVIKIGNKIYFNDYADHVPFAAICPNIMPYRFFGLSTADDLMDIQLLKTGIWRGSMDSLSFALRPQIGVMESMVNLDDLLVRRPGGVVRFKTNPNMAWSPLEHRFVGQAAFPMLEYADAVKENRTGHTRYSQGLDANSLNKTATGVSLITNASQKRLKLIARMFAETGLKDLFRGLNGLIIKHNPKPMMIRLRNEFTEVDPRTWKSEWDMTVNVGLGTGDKAAQAAHLQQVMQVQMGLKQVAPHIVSDTNLYNSAKRVAETSGFKTEGEFFTAPGPQNPPPQPPPPPEIVKAQMEAQANQEKLASQERVKQMELENGQTVAEIQRQASIAVAEIKATTDLQLEQMREQSAAALAIVNNAHKEQLEKIRAERKPAGEAK